MISLFLRAFLQVFLVALNVRYISQERYLRAFLTGCAISLVWWYNAHSAAHMEGVEASLVYCLGAGLGTISGMYLGRR